MRLFKYRIPDTGDIVTCPGSPVETLFTPSFNGSEIVLLESGTVDVQERINSYAPYTDISYMLSQLKVGDTSVLSPRSPMYGDFSSMPSHPVDALNLISDVEHRFDSLPDDVKASYNNDWRVYFTGLFSPSLDGDAVVSDHVPASDSSDKSTGGMTNAT